MIVNITYSYIYIESARRETEIRGILGRVGCDPPDTSPFGKKPFCTYFFVYVTLSLPDAAPPTVTTKLYAVPGFGQSLLVHPATSALYLTDTM